MLYFKSATPVQVVAEIKMWYLTTTGGRGEMGRHEPHPYCKTTLYLYLNIIYIFYYTQFDFTSIKITFFHLKQYLVEIEGHIWWSEVTHEGHK